MFKTPPTQEWIEKHKDEGPEIIGPTQPSVEPSRSCASSTGSAPTLNREQIEILHHTEHRAARGLYCGGSKDMDALVALGLMESAGCVSWCPDEYFRITGRGSRKETKMKSENEIETTGGRPLERLVRKESG